MSFMPVESSYKLVLKLRKEANKPTTTNALRSILVEAAKTIEEQVIGRAIFKKMKDYYDQ